MTDKDDPKYWEHYFAREIDTLCGQALENIIAKVTLFPKNAVILSKKDREVLAKIIVAQMIRIPDSVDYMTEHLYPRVSKQVKEDIASSLPQFLLEKYGDQLKNLELSEQFQKELLLNHAFAPENFERYCGILQEGVWVLYVNMCRERMPFLTSDNPVLVEGVGNKATGLFRNGLANPATCIFYPLSPEIAVSIYSRQGILGVVADEYDGRKVQLDEMQHIISRNVKIMDQAYYYSFIPQPLFDEIRNSSI